MNRSPSLLIPWHSRSRTNPERVKERLRIAIAYWLLRNDRVAAGRCYVRLGGESTVKKCCAEFATDSTVVAVRTRRVNAARWMQQLDDTRARTVLGMGAVYAERKHFGRLLAQEILPPEKVVPKRSAFRN